MAIKTPEEKKSNSANDSQEIKAKGKSKEIPIDDNVKDDNETVQMDFADEDDANSHAARATKPSKDSNDIDPNKPIDEIQKEIFDYEEFRSGKLEYKDLYKQAEFLITIVDTGLSTVFKLIAKGKHAADYEMPERNKKLLTEQLTMILAKYQSKFKVEYMFFVGLLALYVPMGVASVQNRKEVNNDKKQKEKLLKDAERLLKEAEPAKTAKEPFYRHKEGNEPEKIELESEKIKPLEKIEIPAGKLKKDNRGRRAKAY